MRVVLDVSYDGSRYHGWQKQPNPRIATVQDELNKALCNILNIESINTVCAGRTDRGVHAVSQIVHFDTEIIRDISAYTKGLNSYLPPDISIKNAKFVDDNFHARFSAKSRTYRYFIYSSPNKEAQLNNKMTWVYYDLNIDAMQNGAQYLIGEHDFSSFRGPHCQSLTPVREVFSISINKDTHYLLPDVNVFYIEITANAFLHNMVRNIVGVLLHVGKGAKDPNWVKDVLNARNRSAAFNAI